MLKNPFLLILFFISTLAAADNINELVFFGDSLSDNGNLYHETNSLMPKSPPYYRGQFSNGPVWSELLKSQFEKIDNAHTLNYAIGGAMASPHNLVSHLHHFLNDEVNHFLSNNKTLPKEKILYIFWIGSNDYIDIKSPCDIELETKKTVKSIQTALETLANNNGHYFIILNLPDLSKTPLGSTKTPADQKNLFLLVQSHNQKLFQAIQHFKTTHPALHIIYQDIYNDFKALLNNPAPFNQQFHQHITNTTDPCWSHGYLLQPTLPSSNLYQSASLAEASQNSQLHYFGSPCSNPENHVFWDKLHPSAATHQILAQLTQKALFNENIK